MPGPMPPKKDDNTEELMKGVHGVFKALAKMEEMNGKLKPAFAKAKAAIKDAFADVLKGDPSTLDSDAPPPPSDNNTPPPDAPAPPPPDAPPPAA